jgi:hypothetical protein
MAETVQDAIRSYNEPVNDVLFTGHSAGGAVAALLYLHFQLTHVLGNAKLLLFLLTSEFPDEKTLYLIIQADMPLHCITFAAPPMVSVPDISSALRGTVSSAQYTTSQFLAFAAYGDFIARADRPYVRQVLQIYSSSGAAAPLPDFQFDPVELWNAGNLIVLFDKSIDSDEEEIHAVEATQGLGEYLWGNLHTHDMKVYLELLSGL